MSKEPVKTVSSALDPSVQERRQSYNRAVREARLVKIVLSAVKFGVKRSVPFSEASVRKLSYGGEVVEFAVVKKNALGASIKWSVNIKSGRKQVATCMATYNIVYDNFSSLDDETARLFAENVAQPATYAYFRALYANLDWSAELRSPPLPVIKFHPKI